MGSAGLQILISSSMHAMEVAVVAGEGELGAFVERGLGLRKLGLFVGDVVAVGLFVEDVVEGDEVCAMVVEGLVLEVEQHGIERMVDMDCVEEVDSHAVEVAAAVVGMECGAKVDDSNGAIVVDGGE